MEVTKETNERRFEQKYSLFKNLIYIYTYIILIVNGRELGILLVGNYSLD
jgi:hypothetical protein